MLMQRQINNHIKNYFISVGIEKATTPNKLWFLS